MPMYRKPTEKEGSSWLSFCSLFLNSFSIPKLFLTVVMRACGSNESQRVGGVRADIRMVEFGLRVYRFKGLERERLEV